MCMPPDGLLMLSKGMDLSLNQAGASRRLLGNHGGVQTHGRDKQVFCHSKITNLNFNTIEPICMCGLLNFKLQYGTNLAALR